MDVKTSVGVELGCNVGKTVGWLDGLGDGSILGTRLGLLEGTAFAQVSQHIRKTDGKEHLKVGSSVAAHSQVFCIP